MRKIHKRDESEMSLLNDIVVEATAKDADLTRLLRLCLVLGARLKYAPLQRWVKNELNGYALTDVLPPYRQLAVINRGEFVGQMETRQFDIPLSIIPTEFRSRYESAELRDSIAEYVYLANGLTDGKKLCIPWPVEIAMLEASKLVHGGQCRRAWMEISCAGLVGMLDQVKSKVLGFALDIEAEAPNAGEIDGLKVPMQLSSINQIFITNISGQVGAVQTGNQSTSNAQMLSVADAD